MIRRLLCTTLALVLLPQATEANDIVDFFKAISGPAPRSHAAPRSHVSPRHHEAQHAVSPRGIDRRVQLSQRSHVGASHAHGRPIVIPTSQRDRGSRGPVRGVQLSSGRNHSEHNHGVSRPSRIGSSGFSFHVSLGNQSLTQPRYVSTRQFAPQPTAPYPPVVLPAPPLPTAPFPGQSLHVPHQLGDIVTCPVPVFSHVHVERANRIARNAVPTIIAVRDPGLGPYQTCVEQMVYVEVLAPPCPPRLVRVSPCRTRVKMDYGRYEVTIESRNGCVTVEYDN